MSTAVPLEDQLEFVRLYQQGLTLAEIAEKTYWARTTVHRNLKLHGVQMRSRGIGWHKRTAEHTDDFLRTCELYKHYSAAEVAKMLGISRSTVTYRVRRMGTKVRPPGPNLRWSRQPQGPDAP